VVIILKLISVFFVLMWKTHLALAVLLCEPSLRTYKRTRKMIKEICKDKEGRNLNCWSLGGRLRVSASIAHQMLKENGFRSVKESTKPGLTEEMKKAQLEFYKAHEHWTLED
jgi:hypothetical protein